MRTQELLKGKMEQAKKKNSEFFFSLLFLAQPLPRPTQSNGPPFHEGWLTKCGPKEVKKKKKFFFFHYFFFIKYYSNLKK